MTIQTLLALVPDLTEDRRAQLAADYDANTLSPTDKEELSAHMFALLARMDIEMQEAKALLK